MREDHAVEGALLAKNNENTTKNQNKGKVRKFTHLVSIVKNWVTYRSDVGSDQM